MTFGLYSKKIPKSGDRELAFNEMIDEIRKDKELEEIYLRENRLTEKHIEQLANALSEHTNLKFIELSYNGGIHGAAILSLKEIIQHHPEFEKLRLEHNQINDDDIAALVENNSVEFNKKLGMVDIDFSCNRITKIGLKEAAKILSPNSILSILTGNHITDEELIEQYEQDAISKLKAKKLSPEKIDVAPKPFTPLANITQPVSDKKDSPKRKAENPSSLSEVEEFFPKLKEFVAKANQEQLEHFIKSTRDMWEQEHKKPRTEQTDRPFNNKGITTSP